MHPDDALSPPEAFAGRSAAAILDAGLIVLVYSAVHSTGLGSTESLWVTILVAFVYLVIAQGLTGYTLGKAVIGVQSVRLGTTTPAGFKGELLRAIVLLFESGVIIFAFLALFKLTSWAIVILVLITIGGFFRINNNPKRQRLGDRFAHTEVVAIKPRPKPRLICSLLTVALYFGLLAITSTEVTIAILAVFAPMILGIIWAIVGVRYNLADWAWIVGGAFAFVPALMMSSISVCPKTGGSSCPGPAVVQEYELATVALGVLVAVALLVMLVQSVITRYIYAAGVIFAEVWMYERMKDVPDLKLGANLMIFFLILGIFFEGRKAMKRRRDAIATRRLESSSDR